jgi:hypothetical protein
MDFSHLRKLEVREKTSCFIFDDITGEPTFEVKPATQSNPKYFNALLRSSKSRISRAKKGVIDDTMLKQNRDEDRKLFPRHVIVGWENVMDSSGKEVPFSIENCTEFLEKLPDWLFDKLRDFAASNENFVEEVIDVEELSKN